MAAMELPPLPPKPRPPENYDCCGGGCADCELRLYTRALGEWKRLEAAHLAASSAANRPGLAAPGSTGPQP